MNNGDSLPRGVSVYLRGQTWWYKARIDGKLVRRSTGREKKDAAIEYVMERVVPLLAARDLDEVAGRVQTLKAGVSPVRLADVWGMWSELPKPQVMGQRVLSGYRTPWEMWVRWLAAHEQVAYLHQTTDRQAVRFMKSLAGLSGRTRAEYRRSCRRITRDMMRRAGMVANPWDEIPIPRLDIESYDAFTPEQLQLIGEKATGWLLDVFVTGAYTGLRLSDIARLRWAPAGADEMVVDMPEGYIYGRMSKTRNRSRSQGYVELPILEPLKAHLRALKVKPGEKVYPALAAYYAKSSNDLSRDLQAFLRDDLKLEVRRDVEGRNREALKLGVHSLRHTFIYQAGAAGIPLSVVQQIVGHMSEAMTMLYNRHAKRAEVRAQMQRFPQLLKPGDADAVEDLEALLSKLAGDEAVKDKIRRLLG